MVGRTLLVSEGTPPMIKDDKSNDQMICNLHPDLKDASLDKACNIANTLVNSFDGRRINRAPIDKGQLAFDLSYMLEYLRLNFELVPKK